VSHDEDITRRSFLAGMGAAFLGLTFRSGLTPRRQQTSQVYKFVDGRWFDGEKFRSRNFYSVGGVLASRQPAKVDSVIDLTGKYLIPPFAEAHNHNVEGSGPAASDVSGIVRMYLQDGVYYVKNPNCLPRTTRPIFSKVNLPSSIDATFANGGLTATGGHPLEVVKRNVDRGVWTEADGEGAFYFIINDRADLDRKWESIKAGKPDFIKVYLLYSEEYEKRRDDPAYFGWKGLNPQLLPEIVKRAHKNGLRVSAHIESAADFHNALVGGVDEINHMPGFRPEGATLAGYHNLAGYEISESDARLAARKGVVVVTTLWGNIERSKATVNKPDAATGNLVHNLIVRNLQLLKKHHVRITIGSDQYRQNSVPEALNLHELKVFSNVELLKMWCEATPATIFPNRKIGHLENGYEASFLALSGDPLEDFLNVRKIELRVKQGEVLSNVSST
jgi:hypothetical protein